MPVITIALSQTSSEMKKSLISALTATAASVTRIPEASFVVLVQELPEDAIGVGGRALPEIKSARK
jgi:4-oxalocrotonate tautomerase